MALTKDTPRRKGRGYDRRTDLPRVLPVLPEDLDDESPLGRQRILAKLRAALRAERRRGIAGHWTYDLARHAELLRVYRHELALTAPADRVRTWHPESTGGEPRGERH
jgi:hypothetical protein